MEAPRPRVTRAGEDRRVWRGLIVALTMCVVAIVTGVWAQYHLPPDRFVSDPPDGLYGSLIVDDAVSLSLIRVDLRELASGLWVVRIELDADSKADSAATITVQNVKLVGCELIPADLEDDRTTCQRTKQRSGKDTSLNLDLAQAEVRWVPDASKLQPASQVVAVLVVGAPALDMGIAANVANLKVATPSFLPYNNSRRSDSSPIRTRFVYYTNRGPSMTWSGMVPMSIWDDSVAWTYETDQHDPVRNMSYGVDAGVAAGDQAATFSSGVAFGIATGALIGMIEQLVEVLLAMRGSTRRDKP